MCATRSAQALDDRSEERSGATGRLNDEQVSKITIGGIPNHVEHSFDHTSAGETSPWRRASCRDSGRAEPVETEQRTSCHGRTNSCSRRHWLLNRPGHE